MTGARKQQCWNLQTRTKPKEKHVKLLSLLKYKSRLEKWEGKSWLRALLLLKSCKTKKYQQTCFCRIRLTLEVPGEGKRVRITNGGSCLQDNWDDDDDENKEEAEVKPEVKISEKKKIAEKIKEKERQQKKRQEEIKKRLEEPEDSKVLTPEEQLADKLRLKKLQEESDLELAKETFGVNNTVYGIDAMNPSSRDDFTEFGKLLKDKITQYEKSLYYASFLEALVRDVCISLEIDDLKKITNSLTVLCSEKQKQEKQSKAKKKKKGVVPGGGLKATMKDDLADYGGYDGGYVQDYEDFM